MHMYKFAFDQVLKEGGSALEAVTEAVSQCRETGKNAETNWILSKKFYLESIHRQKFNFNKQAVSQWA